MTSYNIFIGYDEREPEAYEVCKQSILKHTDSPVNIYKLEHRELRQKGLFNRPWVIDEQGRYLDQRDGKFFSTQFSHTRFLVPHIARELGLRQALFVDSDFLFRTDVKELFEQTNDLCVPVFCVKHDFQVKEGASKMDGQVQTNYPMKLWSSLMMFNILNKRLDKLTPDYVNYMPGSYLHRFEFLKSNSFDKPEIMIGSIEEAWNFIPDHSEKNVDKPKAIHYTYGVPSMKGFEKTKYSEEYWKVLDESQLPYQSRR
jgi:hypothetical protein